MSFVICTLPNASNNINGVEFEDHKEGKISVAAVNADQAEAFAQIDGYKVVDSKEAKAAKPTAAEKKAAEEEAAAKAAAEKEAADAEAAAKADAEAAEKAASDAAAPKAKK